MKTKLHIVTLVAAILCLASMLFSYVSIDLFVVKFGIRWVDAARYTNYVLYAVPVIGILMLLSSVLDIKPLLWASAVAAICVGVYYLVTYRDILNGDMLVWLRSTNILLSQHVDMSDMQYAVEYLKPFLRLGIGAWLYLISCLIALVGVFVDASAANNTTKSKNAKHDTTYNNDMHSYY